MLQHGTKMANAICTEWDSHSHVAAYPTVKAVVRALLEMFHGDRKK